MAGAPRALEIQLSAFAAAFLMLIERRARALVELLRTVFLVHVVPGWRPGLRSRELRAPKCTQGHVQQIVAA
ncbi:MAG TPA: hypothetical protein VIJ50_03400 [Solirubrobacteraceae bacterium]